MINARTTRIVTLAATATVFASLSASAFAAAPASHAPVGPNATGPARFGLCTAYAASATAHPSNLSAIAFTNLLAAAQEAGQTIEAFCATGTTDTTATPDTTSTTSTITGTFGSV